MILPLPKTLPIPHPSRCHWRLDPRHLRCHGLGSPTFQTKVMPLAGTQASHQPNPALVPLSTVDVTPHSLPGMRQQSINGDRLFTVRCTALQLQSAVLLSHVVCPSVRLSMTLVDHDTIRYDTIQYDNFINKRIKRA